MGADYMVRSWREPPADMRVLLEQIISEEKDSKIIEQKSMLASGTDSKGSGYSFSVTGTEDGFPLYGSFKVEDLQGIHDSPKIESGGVYLDSSLKSRGFEIGQKIRIGNLDLVTLGFIKEEPQSSNFIGSMGYRAVLSLADLKKSDLLVLGARVSHRFLLKSQLKESAIRQKFREKFPDKYWRLISVRQGTEQVARLTGILSTILVFFAVLASLMGSLTTYFLFRIRIRKKLPELLTLKCLGLRTAEILKSNLLLFLFLALIGIVSGFLVGVLAEKAVAVMAAKALGAELSLHRPWFPTFLRVCFVAFMSVIWATFFPLRDALGVPVNQIFSGDREGNRVGSRGAQRQQAIALLLMSFSYIWIFSPSLMQAAITFGVLVAAALSSLLVVELFLRFLRKFFMEGRKLEGFLLIRSLVRNPLRTRIVLASLLLGITVVTSAFLVSNSLRQQIAVARSERSSDLLLLSPDDPSRDQVSLIPHPGATIDWLAYSQVRVYRADGSPIREVKSEGKDSEDADEIGIREYFVNYRSFQAPKMRGENLLKSAGIFGAPAPDLIRLSLESEFAKRVQVGLGEILLLEIGGVRLKGRVDSLREVNWFNFSPNFFIVACSEDLEGAPRAWIGLARFDDTEKSMVAFQNSVAKISPQSLALDTQTVATKVLDILKKIDATVFWISIFLMLTLLVLVWGISAGRLMDWPQEKILFRSLGLRESRQRNLLLGELALLWICALILGALLASGMAWVISGTLFKFSLWWPNPLALLQMLMAFVFLVGLSLLTLRRGI